MTTSVGLALCGRCGATVDAAVDVCPVCTGAIARSVLSLATVGPLSSGAPSAPPGRRALGVALSIIAPWALAAGSAVAFSSRGVFAALVLGAVVAAILITVQSALWLRTGRALGNVVTRTRSVRADDGTAPGMRIFRARPRGRAAGTAGRGVLGRLLGVVTVIVSAQHDPLWLATTGPASLPPRASGVIAPETVTREIVLTFDERLRIPLVRSVIIGRNPPRTEGDTISVAVPDLSRSISNSHVRLDNERGRVFARDLGSTNGTELVTHAGARLLSPGERIEIPAGAYLLLAGSPLRLNTGHASVGA